MEENLQIQVVYDPVQAVMGECLGLGRVPAGEGATELGFGGDSAFLLCMPKALFYILNHCCVIGLHSDSSQVVKFRFFSSEQ